MGKELVIVMTPDSVADLIKGLMKTVAEVSESKESRFIDIGVQMPNGPIQSIRIEIVTPDSPMLEDDYEQE